MSTELLHEIATETRGASPAQPVPILLTVRELNLGGIERDVTKIALKIDRSRFMPHVASYTGEGMRFEELRRAGVPLLHLSVTSLKSASTLSAALKMRRYIQECRIQLVHAYDSSVVFFAPLARALGVPAVLSSTLGYRDLHDPRTRREVRWTDKIVDAVVVNCEAMRRHMVDDEGMPRARIELCYNGVNTNEFHPDAARKPAAVLGAALVIGAVCALRPEKAMDLLQEAFARVRSRRSGLKLVIVGSGSELAKLEANSRRLGIEEDCLFVPATRSVAEFLRSFDIYVSCSRSEAFSNTILEAMACGRAVVGSRVGGTPELIGDERGVLFEPCDAAGLAEKLEWLIENPACRDALGARAAEFARKKLSVEIAAARMAEIYSLVLRRKLAC